VRKRILIGLLAVLVIGVVAFFVLQPRKGSVEWHKKEYLAAKNRLEGHTWFSPIYERYCKSRPFRVVNDIEAHALRERMRVAQRALVDLGYLSERTFTVSNHSSMEIGSRVISASWKIVPRDRQELTAFFWDEEGPVTNRLVITAPVGDMRLYEEFVKRADVP